MTTPEEEPDRQPGAPHPRHTGRIFGQDAAEATLAQAIEGGRLHHAWLLAGPAGVGKASLAWQTARRLLTTPEDPDPTRRIAALSHPGLMLCRRPWDPARKVWKTAITVEVIRGLKGFFALSAADGGWRVAIIDAADQLTTEAANALLKLLEEPPPRAIFFLIAHRPARLLPTIRSRCRTLRLSPLPPDALERAIAAARPEAAEAPLDATLIALAEGSVGAAIALLEQGGAEDYRRLQALWSAAPAMPRGELLALADGLSGRANAERFDQTIRLLAQLLWRVVRAGAGAPGPATLDAEAALAARFVPNAAAARAWAETQASVEARLIAGQRVNLDPGELFLDTMREIETTAARVLAAAR